MNLNLKVRPGREGWEAEEYSSGGDTLEPTLHNNANNS